MGEVRVALPRVEGGAVLVQGEDGALRLGGGWRPVYEALLHGKAALDAVQLVQHISADAGISHGLAALKALERAGGIAPGANALALREVLYACSLLHAHLRGFYFQALPDYLPPAGLAGRYLRRADTRAFARRKPPKASWRALVFPSPFKPQEMAALWDACAEAQEILRLLQRMLALIGGRFPIAMSLIPGGMATPLHQGEIVRLQGLLRRVRHFVEARFSEDVPHLLARHPETLQEGRGPAALFSVGGGLDEEAFRVAPFYPGLLRQGTLRTLAGRPRESLARSRYQLARRAGQAGVLAQPDASKRDARSWIKSPRWGEEAAESGALARLAVTFLAGQEQAPLARVREFEKLAGGPVAAQNTLGGRLLARMVESRLLLEHCQAQLEALQPGRPLIAEERPELDITGEGEGWVESPCGALRHWVALERGRIAFYDIISGSTWNGGPADEAGTPGPLEQALGRARYDLGRAEDVRLCSRIVHSFGLSMSDAIH